MSSAEWIAKTDPQSGKVYYFNKETKATTWTKPDSTPLATASGAGTPTPTDAEGTWVEKVDPKSGKVYYLNKETKQTSWTKPINSSEQSVAVSAGATPSRGASSPTPGGTTSEWIEKTDPKTGKVYYVNTETKQTSWTKPETPGPTTAHPHTAPVVQTAAGLDGWTEKVDKKTGKTYYYNKATNETTWTRPVVGDVSAPEAATAEQSANLNAVVSGAGASPWVEKTDLKTGKTYYVNRQTKETTWTRPPDIDASSVPASVDVSAQDAVPLTPWVEKSDPKSGRPFYYNKETKETSWTKPEALTQATHVVSAPTVAHVDDDPWLPRTDPNTGKTYFFNTLTKATSWTKPDAAATAAAAAMAAAETQRLAQVEAERVRSEDALPMGWVEKQDVVTGRKYYLHTLTKQPSWVRPTIASASARRAGNRSDSGEDGREYVTTSIEGLWEKRFEPRSGSFYYFNVRTHETRWDVSQTGTPTVMLDLRGHDTMYVVGGQPHTREVLKYDGGITGWVVCPGLEMPFELDMPFGFQDGQNHFTVIGRRPHIFADVSVTVGLHHQTAPSSDNNLVISGDVTVTVKNAMASVPVANGVLVCGGYDDVMAKQVSKQCYVMDTLNRKTFALPSLQLGRASHALAVVEMSSDKHLAWYAYAIGGFDGTMKTNVVERYILGQPYWEIVSPMRTPRAAHCAVAADKTIYVVGGRSGYTVLNTGEYLHVQTTGWMEMAPMKASRCNASAASIGSYIFVVGGWSGTAFLDSVEAYDVRLDTWREVQNLPSPRSGFALIMAPLLPGSRPDHHDLRQKALDAKRDAASGAAPRQLTLMEQVAQDMYRKEPPSARRTR
jgi:hypothetical protein